VHFLRAADLLLIDTAIMETVCRLFLLCNPLHGMHSAAALKFYLYSQLEVITAKMLGKYVPRGGTGARVIQLGGGTRELYYYPKDVVLVTNVGEKVNKGARKNRQR
jgi:hypothetical protein